MRSRRRRFPPQFPSVTNMLKIYHDSGRKIGLARRDVLGV
jgi:hypothetical protein